MLTTCKVCGKMFNKGYSKQKNIDYIPSVCSSMCFVGLIYRKVRRERIRTWSLYRKKCNIMRSDYERGVATWLDENQIGWLYECHHIELPSGRVYTPDFYLPDFRSYIEVKGIWEHSAFSKFKEFVKTYGNKFAIYLVDKKFMRRIQCLPRKKEK